jgi:DNA-binding IclR family transcriptional regulator
MSERYVIPSLQRAIRVLGILAQAGRGMSLADLTRRTDIPKSTLFRILITLQKHHCVVLDPESSTYRLGSYLWELGNSFADQSDLFRLAAPVMESLADESEETVFLSSMEGDDVVYLRRVESPKSVTVVKKLNTRVPAHCTATGMALLAWMPEDEVDHILSSHDMEVFNDATVTDRLVLESRLQDTRRREYAVVDGEYNKDLLCVSSPVFDHHQRPCAALTVALLSAQVESYERVEQVGALVRVAARKLSRKLGGKVPTETTFAPSVPLAA